MNRLVVSDSTAIIHLSRINALHLLQALYSEILIPEGVRDEIRAGGSPQPGTLLLLNSPWIKPVAVRSPTILAKLRAHLDLGESEAIALALETNADVLIIDEKKGRAVASKLVNRIIGMVGVLIEAKRANLIGSVQPYLVMLRDTGFAMGDDLFDYALQVAGETKASGTGHG